LLHRGWARIERRCERETNDTMEGGFIPSRLQDNRFGGEMVLGTFTLKSKGLSCPRLLIPITFGTVP